MAGSNRDTPCMALLPTCQTSQADSISSGRCPTVEPSAVGKSGRFAEAVRTAHQASLRASIQLTMSSPHLQASSLFDGKLNILVSS